MAALMASVIIPAFNAERILPACLQAVLDQTLPRDEYEVIVVDDGSSDGTGAAAASPGIRVVAQTHSGPAAARNLGARHAQGPILVFTDADCRPTREWLAAMLRPFDRPEVSGAKGRYRTDQPGAIARLAQAEYEEKYRRLAAQERIDFVDTYSAAYRQDVFLASGGFDTAFETAAMEDPELSFRLAEQGHKLVFVPDAIVFHTHVDSWRRYLRRKFRVGWWAVLSGWKHPRKMIHDSRTPPGQRLQLVLLGLSGIAAAAGFLQPAVWLAIPVLGAGFLATCVPLLRIVLASDPRLAPAVPLLLMVRAASLTSGLCAGAAVFSARWVMAKVARGRTPAHREPVEP